MLNNSASFNEAVYHAWEMALKWLEGNSKAFLKLSCVRHAGDVKDKLKPVSEFLLCILCMKRSGLDVSIWNAVVSQIWEKLENGETLNRIIVGNPDLLMVSQTYATFSELGKKNYRIEENLRDLADGWTDFLQDTPAWQRLGLSHALSRLGIECKNLANRNDIYINRMIAPWLVSEATAYAITHEVFYVTDFGASPELLLTNERDYLRLWVPTWLDYFTKEKKWDIVAELLLVAVICGEVSKTDSLVGQFCALQNPDGSFSASDRQPPLREHSRVEIGFRNCYHTTLVSLILISQYFKGRKSFD